jgi:pyrroloquinoline-quinone synthase
MSGSGTIERIRESYADHPGYQHRFWQWFAQGAFDEAGLRRFALAYYQHVRRFRLYVAGALTIAPSEELQAVLAENLADEYGVPLAGRPAAESHPEMFRRFMRSLGLTETDWEGDEPIEGIRRFQEVHFALFRGGLVSETIGAVVFGMESSTPYRHGMVLRGLDAFGRRTGRVVDAVFFESHVTGDETHSEELIEVAGPFVEADPDGVMRGARLSFDARRLFLDDLGRQVGAPVPLLA